MGQLDVLFRIGDKQQRIEALVKYAKSLKINVLKAKHENGEYSEQELAVMIFDVEQNRKNQKLQYVGVLSGAFFLMIAFLGAMWLFKLISSGSFTF